MASGASPVAHIFSKTSLAILPLMVPVVDHPDHRGQGLGRHRAGRDGALVVLELPQDLGHHPVGGGLRVAARPGDGLVVVGHVTRAT